MLATPRRAIAYPNPDRSDRPDVPTHIYNVAIASDGSVIYNQGTSTARASATHQASGGRVWWETDTLLAWYDDGTTWYSIGLNPNGSFSFTGSTSKLSFTNESLAANAIVASKVAGDTQNRLSIGADGKISWGSGGAIADTFLYRSGVGVVKTDGTLNAVSGYQVNGVALASTHLSDTALLARLASPAFSGSPTAPTPAGSDNSTTIITSAWVKNLAYAPLAGPTFSSPLAVSDTIANQPAIRLIASDAAVDYKNWRERVNGTQLIAEVRNDALNTSAAWLTVTRSGAAVSTVNFPNGTLQYGGNEVAVLSNPTFVGTITTSKVVLSDTIANMPLLRMIATDAGVDSKNWRAYVDGSHLRFDITNDAINVLVNWLVVTRAANTISSVNFPNGTLQSGGRVVQLGARIAGIVASGGGITAGTGFTITKTGTGTYTINFTVAFSAVPAFLVSVANGTSGKATCNTIGTGSVLITTFDSGNTPTDMAFSFLAQDMS